MRQVLQDLKTGKTEVVEVPCPAPRAGHLLIETRVSLVSAGTERMLVDFGKAGYLQKARQQPDKVRQVIEKIRTDGLGPTLEAVRAKLDQPIPLGYCNVGTVVRAESSKLKAQSDPQITQICADGGRGEEDHPLTFSPSKFKPGDRVASNGPHAEVVRVPVNLCAKVPDGVTDEEAVFTVLGAIGLQGVRLAQPTLGECFVVTGLGLIGLLTVQILKANGCRVLGVDVDSGKCELAREFGAEAVDLSRGEDPAAAGTAFSQDRGVDGVLICAATKSSDPVHQAAQMCRKRGRIVLVGVTGLELSRDDFYKKELSFQVSCSYGPGRYDPEYEEKGQDYPIGHVRWTEQRNFEAVLGLMAEGKLNVKPLITHRFSIEEAEKAYGLIGGGGERYLGIVLEYGEAESSKLKAESAGGTTDERRLTQIEDVSRKDAKAQSNPQISQITQISQKIQGRKPSSDLGPRTSVSIGFIGAGNYASRVLIPAFKAAGAQLHTLVTSGGVSAAIHGKKAGFAYASTDVEGMLADQSVNTVVIATQHNTHARFVIEALKAGKHVFVEKPLCLNLNELGEIQTAQSSKLKADPQITPVKRGQEGFTGQAQIYADVEAESSKLKAERGGAHSDLELPTSDLRPLTSDLCLLMVGFNRRFAPQIVKMKELLGTVKGPKSFVMTVNAGAIPGDHWTQDKEVGGGRIIGEACHFIDLLRFLAGSPIVSHGRSAMGSEHGDTVSIQLEFENGSIGTVHYFANGSKAFPKERLEVFCAGRVLQLDNFRKMTGYGWPGFKKMNLWKQDKGQEACVAAFLNAVRNGGPPPIPFNEIMEVSRTTIQLGSQP